MSNTMRQGSARGGCAVVQSGATALPDPATLMAAIFPRRRVRLVVEVSLDPVPGWGNDPEDYRALTQRLLDDSIGHYRPTVTIEPSS